MFCFVTSVMLKAVHFYYVGTYSVLFLPLFYSILRLLSDTVLFWNIVFSYSRGPQILCTMSPGRPNLLWWPLKCVDSKYGICFVSASRYLVLSGDY